MVPRTVRKTIKHRQEQEQPSAKTLVFCLKNEDIFFGIDVPMFWTLDDVLRMPGVSKPSGLLT